MKKLSLPAVLLSSAVAAIALVSQYALTTITNQIFISLFVTFLLIVGLFSLGYWYVIERQEIKRKAEILAKLGLSDTDKSLLDLYSEQSTQIHHSGKNINTKVCQLAMNSAEVSFFLDNLSTAIVSSGDDVDRLAVSAEKMSSHTGEVSANATLSSDLSTEAMDATKQEISKLNHTVEVIDKLNNDVVSASDKITKLSEKTSEIQKITDVIDAISEQTNLLALNAAIEAARAGEQGRGFAVVADEVRALAGKTADATEQIGLMLQEVSAETSQTTEVMEAVVSRTHSVVETIAGLSEGLVNTNELISNASQASQQISLALHEQNEVAENISSSIGNLHQFLVNKGEETKSASLKGEQLSSFTESIFIDLSSFETESLVAVMAKQAQTAAKDVGELFEQQIKVGKIEKNALFDFSYHKISDTNPQKYTTSFDQFTDKVLPSLQEPILKKHEEVIYAGTVDINGYFPTHNACFSLPLSGIYEKDVAFNRTKRIFDDPTGIRCGKHTEQFLLQTYKRDTGEIMHDVSAPIYVNGQHWGGFRMGFRAK